MKDIKVVTEKLSVQDINLDKEQIAFLEEFIKLDSMYKPKTFFLAINRLETYIYGAQLEEAKQCCYKQYKIAIFQILYNFILLNLCNLCIIN